MLRGTVRVQVLDGDGNPAVGVPVVYVDPDGSVAGRVATDAAGSAEADVLPGASVTSVVGVENGFVMRSVLAVHPGDDITLANRFLLGPQTGSFTVNWAAHPSGDATFYFLVTPCGQRTVFATTDVAPMYVHCERESMDVLVVAWDIDGNPLGYLEDAAVPYSDGGSTTMPTDWQSTSSVSMAYSNIGPEITRISWSRSVPDILGLTTSRNGVPSGASLALAAGTLSKPTATHDSFIERDAATQTITQHVAGTVTTFGLDVGAILLPWLAEPTFDPATATIAVADTSSSSPPDLFTAHVIYLRDGVTRYEWTVFAPDAADIVLPAMPPEVGEVNPSAGDTTGALDIELFESDAVDGYDDVRADPYARSSPFDLTAVTGTTVRRSAASYAP